MAFEITSGSHRRARLAARLPRLALLAVCAVLSAAGLRALTAAPSAPIATATAPTASSSLPAEAFAEAFARAFLTWEAKEPEARAQALRRFAPGVAADVETGSGAPVADQSVLWSTVADSGAVRGGRRVTVLAATTNGAVALSVNVVGTSMADLRVDRPPAIVGATPPAQKSEEPLGEPVDDDGLGATVRRALRHYLGGSRDELVADLLPGAHVVLPEPRLSLVAIDDLVWARPRRSVVAVVRARPDGGGELRLGYEVGVAREAGRWFVRWIEDPTTREAGS